MHKVGHDLIQAVSCIGGRRTIGGTTATTRTSTGTPSLVRSSPFNRHDEKEREAEPERAKGRGSASLSQSQSQSNVAAKDSSSNSSTNATSSYAQTPWQQQQRRERTSIAPTSDDQAAKKQQRARSTVRKSVLRRWLPAEEDVGHDASDDSTPAPPVTKATYEADTGTSTGTGTGTHAAATVTVTDDALPPATTATATTATTTITAIATTTNTTTDTASTFDLARWASEVKSNQARVGAVEVEVVGTPTDATITASVTAPDSNNPADSTADSAAAAITITSHPTPRVGSNGSSEAESETLLPPPRSKFSRHISGGATSTAQGKKPAAAPGLPLSQRKIPHELTSG